MTKLCPQCGGLWPCFNCAPPTDATARHSDPSTSHEAAERISMTKREQQVLDFLLARKPRQFNEFQIAAGTGIDKSSVTPRMRPLHRKGWLNDPVVIKAFNDAGNFVNLLHWSAK